MFTTRSISFRIRRSVLAAIVLGGLLLGAGCSSARDGAARSGIITSATNSPDATDPADTTAADSADDPGTDNASPSSDAGEDALDRSDDSQGYPDGEGADGDGQPVGADRGVDLEPVGDDDPTPPPGLCDDVVATGASLVVTPEPAVLPSGTMSSVLTVTNCGVDAMDWVAATVPNVVLANAGGNLSPGSSSELLFTIDSSAYEPGAVEFKVKISETGHNHYVDVHAFRELVGSDFVGDLGLSAGPEAGGCANQCITSALLSANAPSPDLTLKVAMNTPAVVNVYVSAEGPVDKDGHPVFPGVNPVATSGGETTGFTTRVSPLAPATKYFIIVEATDANGNTSYQSGSFTTITPVETVHEGVDHGGGCADQCITLARVTPGPTFRDVSVEVEADTSAIIEVWVSDERSGVNDTPNFDGEPAASTDPLDVAAWAGVITGLIADREYEVLVKATDLTGNSSYRGGSFHTPAGPRIMARFHAVHVVGDGDAGGSNRGELSFRWGFGDFTLGTRGEDEMHSGHAFLLPDNLTTTAFIIQDDGGEFPIMRMTASERDPDGLVESCQMGTGAIPEPGYSAGCDAKWNVATSGSITSADFDGMPRCSQFELPAELADSPCTTLVSQDDLSDDYPEFWVVVSFQEIG